MSKVCVLVIFKINYVFNNIPTVFIWSVSCIVANVKGKLPLSLKSGIPSVPITWMVRDLKSTELSKVYIFWSLHHWRFPSPFYYLFIQENMTHK